MSQEECAKFRDSVPYVKVYRYNPKHLYPKSNGYGDNGQRKVGLLAVPNTATRTADLHVTQLMSLRLIPGMNSVHAYTKMCIQQSFISTSIQLAIHAPCKLLGNPKDDYGVNASVYVVKFNGFTSLIR
jgi:hypothetical protein